MSEPINFAKMDADLDSNPKIRRAGRAGKEVYLFVLRRVAKHRAQGRIPVSNVDPWYLHDMLQITEEEAERGLAACLRPWASFDGEQEPGLLAIEGGMVVVTGWTEDWGRYPMTEAERKAAQRARDRAADAPTALSAPPAPPALPPAPDVTPDVTPPRDVSGHVTNCPDSHGSDQIRSDQKEGGEGKPPRKRGRAPSPSSSALLPIGWAPVRNDEFERACASATARGVDVDDQLAKFVVHMRHTGDRSADWNARCVKWILDAHTPSPDELAAREAVQRTRRAAERRSVERAPVAVVPMTAAELAAVTATALAAAKDPDAATRALAEAGAFPDHDHWQRKEAV